MLIILIAREEGGHELRASYAAANPKRLKSPLFALQLFAF
jgi:hypothetical protein